MGMFPFIFQFTQIAINESLLCVFSLHFVCTIYHQKYINKIKSWPVNEIIS